MFISIWLADKYFITAVTLTLFVAVVLLTFILLLFGCSRKLHTEL